MEIVKAQEAVQLEVAQEADFYYAQSHVQCLLGQDVNSPLGTLVTQVGQQIRVIASVMKDPAFAVKSLIKNDTFVMFNHVHEDMTVQKGILAWQDQKLRLFIETSQKPETTSFMDAFVQFVTQRFGNKDKQKKPAPTTPSDSPSDYGDFDDDAEIIE